MSNYSLKKINKIWETAHVHNEKIKTEWRKDYTGAWINKKQYGDESEYGWELNHKKTISKNGNNELSNLVALHWKNNRTKDDDYPSFKTSVSSNGSKNILKEQSWRYK